MLRLTASLWKSRGLCDKVEKYVTSRRGTSGNKIRRMRFAFWLVKTINTLTINTHDKFSTSKIDKKHNFTVTWTLPNLFSSCDVLTVDIY